MTTLKFVPVLKGDPNAMSSIPACAGVYILGVMKVIGEENTFCPLYVGKILKKGIKKRIIEHYDPFGHSAFNSCNELFDMTMPMSDVYTDIKIWNNTYNHQIQFKAWKTVYKAIKTHGKDTLIWHNNGAFYDHYLGQPGISSYTKNAGHIAMEGKCGEFACMSKRANQIKDVHDLMARFYMTKGIILKDFAFTYTCIDLKDALDQKTSGVRNPQLELEEAAVKCALEARGAWTYSKRERTCAEVNLQSPPIQVDFSNITNLY